MSFTWLLALAGLSISGVKTAEEYGSYYETTSDISVPQDLDVIQLDINTLSQKVDENYKKTNARVFFQDGIFASKDILLIKNFKVRIKESKDSNLKIEETLSSRGKTQDQAKTLVEEMGSQYTLDGNKLNLKGFVEIKRGSHFRDQEADYTIYLPKGKKIITRQELSDNYVYIYGKVNEGVIDGISTFEIRE